MSKLELKSRSIRVFDYHDIDLTSYAVALKPDPDILAYDILNLRRRLAKEESVDQVEENDLVRLSCSSPNPVFNKKHLDVRIGLGLFSKEAEAKLIGMRLNEEKTIAVTGESLTVSIEKITRQILPELTDALIQAADLPGVKTAGEALTMCRYRQYDDILEEPLDEAYAFLSREIMANSVFTLDKDEIQTAHETALRALDSKKDENGVPIKDMSDEEAIKLFGLSYPQWQNQCLLIGEGMLKCATLGQNYFLLSEEDYENCIAKRARGLMKKADEVKNDYSLTQYMIETYAEQYMDMLEQYALKRLKEIGEEIGR